MKPTGIFLTIVAAAVAVVVAYDSGIQLSSDTAIEPTGAVSQSAATPQTVQTQAELVDEPAPVPAAQFDAPPLSTAEQQYTASVSDFVGPLQLDHQAADSASTENPQGAKPVAPREKLSGPVAALLASGAKGSVELVVRYDERPELFDDELVADLGGTVTRTYEHLEMRAVELPVASLLGLASDSNVDWVSLDDEMSATSLSSRVAANLPDANSANGGYSGLHVGVAVLDTGVSDHADLGDQIVQYSFLGGAYPTPSIENGTVAALNDNPRIDGFGHGTHVAGLLVGNGSKSNDDYAGSAKASKVLSLQVLDENGGGSMSDVMAALDWLLTYGDYFDIRVVNLSLGKSISESNQTDPLVLAVERLWDAGMVVVVAAGNDGYSGSMTVNSPANSRKVITVGSVTDNDTGLDYSDDYVSSFSSQGPTIGDYVLKPDLIAPGNRLVAAVSLNSKLAIALSKRIKACKVLACAVEDAYLEMSGTSMATPMVSAVVALMLEKDPTLSPATVKARLMRSARKMDAGPTEAGAGMVDADAALNDSGVVFGEALSPLMIFDAVSSTVLVEDTGVLWGDELWGSAYLFSNGNNWASGATYVDANGVTANGYMWTDSNVSAKGYQWTDGIEAKGYQWTDGVEARSLLDGDAETEFFLNDDGPVEQ